jgi:hypothetical protein
VRVAHRLGEGVVVDRFARQPDHASSIPITRR